MRQNKRIYILKKKKTTQYSKVLNGRKRIIKKKKKNFLSRARRKKKKIFIVGRNIFCYYLCLYITHNSFYSYEIYEMILHKNNFYIFYMYGTVILTIVPAIFMRNERNTFTILFTRGNKRLFVLQNMVFFFFF